jgi:hypothetical protein
VEATIEENFDLETIINSSSEELLRVKPEIEDPELYARLEKKTENFKEGMWDKPYNPKPLIDLIDFLHTNDIYFGNYLNYVCEHFIKVHLRSPATSSIAILFLLLENLLFSNSSFSNETRFYNTDLTYFTRSLETNSMRLYLTQAWLEKKCKLKAADYSLFRKTNVYKYKLLIKLDARIAEIEKDHPAIDTMDLSTLTEESKVLLTEYFTLKELHSVVDFSSYPPQYFYLIPSVISKHQELAKFLTENLDSFKLKNGYFKSSKNPDMHDRYKEHYAFVVLNKDIKKHKADASFSENLKRYLKSYISKLEFISLILSEKYLTDTLSDLLESIAPDVIPDYKPPFPYLPKI